MKNIKISILSIFFASLLCNIFFWGDRNNLLFANEKLSKEKKLYIRVLIGENLEEATVRGIDMTTKDAYSLAEIDKEPASIATYRAVNNKIFLGQIPLNTRSIIIDSPAIYLYFNKKEYLSPLILMAKGDKIDVVSRLALENYLVGTVTSEMPALWPQAALEAQAIAARSYAYNQMQKNKSQHYDIVDDIRDQMYKGTSSEQATGLSAVKKTKNWVVAKDNKIVETFYHSTCAGITEPASLVWNHIDTIFPPVKCSFCKKATSYRWSFQANSSEVASLLKPFGFYDETIINIDVTTRSASGRALFIEISGKTQKITLEGDDFRKKIGTTRLKSTRFSVRNIGNSKWVFDGEGYGHGVGMCQWGAKRMAELGFSAKEILEYYYQGTSVMQMVFE